MKKIVVTGATSMLGLALINDAVKHGIKVLAMMRAGSKKICRLPKSELISILECDIDEMDAIDISSLESDYDVFYHFAWAHTDKTTRNDPVLHEKNIKYALDAVELAHKLGCKKFIGAGSQAEYGRVEGTLKATTPAFPEMGYGIGKLCAGHMTREHAHQLGMEHMWVRILSIYGPNDGLQSMVMSTIQKLTDGVVPQFTKGEQMWDYLYSGDAGNALYLVGEKGIDSKVYILGSGNARPLKDYIEEIRQVVDPNAQIDLGAVPYGARQVMYLCADINELTVDTGFTPKVSFTEGIEKTVNWYKGEYKA